MERKEFDKHKAAYEVMRAVWNALPGPKLDDEFAWRFCECFTSKRKVVGGITGCLQCGMAVRAKKE